MSENNHIVTEVREHTGIIKINRPDVYNALNGDNKWAIAKAIREFNKDNNVSAIILTGEGKAFSTGQDLNDRQAADESNNLGDTLQTEWNPLVKSIRDSRKPVIAAVNGVTAGAGIAVAISCDFVVCKPNTRFVGGFGKLALCLDAGSTFYLTRYLGEKKTFEFYMTNNPIMSEELHAAGLINHLSEEPLDKALEMAGQLHGCDPVALEVVKTNIQNALEVGYSDSLENETVGQRLLGDQGSYREGIKAFFEKRAPNFRS
jgi:2-(1,2-epoxy-1,2-dihydrophenyl)acetyl-CoA isomerase